MHVDEIETERIDASNDTVEPGLVDELSGQSRHALLGLQLELRKCGSSHRSRLSGNVSS